MKKILINIGALLILSGALRAQDDVYPAAPQKGENSLS